MKELEEYLGSISVEVKTTLCKIGVTKERWRPEALGYEITFTRGRRSESFKYRSQSGPIKVPAIGSTMIKLLGEDRVSRIFTIEEIDEIYKIIN